MKENYNAPEIVVYEMNEDVITTSPVVDITDPDIDNGGWL